MTQPPVPPQLDLMANAGLFIQPEWRIQPWGQLGRKPLKIQAGRGSLALLDHPRGVLVERAYRHGGLRRFFFAEWFWHNARPSHEFSLHHKAFAGKIPSVEPVGWREKSGLLPGWRKYWYYTVYLPGAHSLTNFLHTSATSQPIINQAATLLKSLYDLGIYHSDLNLNNWLVWMSHLRLIDFDCAKLIEWDPRTYVLACLKRMVRSGVKLGFAEHRRLFLRFSICLCRAFEINCRDLLKQLPAHLAHISKWRQFCWKLSGGHRG